MKHKEQIEIAIPTFYLSWLINADCSGLNDDDEKEVKEFEIEHTEGNKHVIFDCWYNNPEPYFGQYNGIGHELIDILITKF